jgi:hypothetical protein
MVGLEGKLDPAGSHFGGTVTGGSQCTMFALERSASTEAVESPCGTAPPLMAQR